MTCIHVNFCWFLSITLFSSFGLPKEKKIPLTLRHKEMIGINRVIFLYHYHHHHNDYIMDNKCVVCMCYNERERKETKNTFKKKSNKEQ